MAKRKTTIEKINAIRSKIHALSEKIIKLQDGCEHSKIAVDRRVVGYNGYGTDYETRCRCELCEKSWFHNGYCTGEGHTVKK